VNIYSWGVVVNNADGQEIILPRPNNDRIKLLPSMRTSEVGSHKNIARSGETKRMRANVDCVRTVLDGR